MAHSGVAINDEVLSCFNNMKIGHKIAYVICKISDDLKEIVIEKVVEKSENKSYEDFREELPKDDCRYAVYDMKFKAKSGVDNEGLAFFAWSPDCAKIKNKMIYASTKDTLKKKLEGIRAEIQATDSSDLDHDEVLSKMK